MPMRLPGILRRFLLAAFGVMLFAVSAAVALIAFPELLYAYHVEHGRLGLYSDRPFDDAKGRALLAEVERRLRRAPAELRDADSSFDIFVTKADWRRRLVFLWNGGARGVNYYPLGGNVFIARADIDTGRALGRNGAPVPAPRTLAYYAAHEIGHSLIGAHIGVIANHTLPAWIREGMADFIGMGGDIDVDALRRKLQNESPDGTAPRDFYARYRMLVAHFLIRRGWSADRLLASNMSLRDAERIRAGGMERQR